MVITLWREAMKTSRLNCKQSIAEGGHTWHSNTCGMLMSGVLMLALPGCTAMAYLPDEAPMTEPSVSVSEEWNGARTSAGINAAELGWQAYFPDAQLQELIETSLENNRDLRIAALRVAEARAAYGIQRADRLPSISVGGQAARSRVPGNLNMTGRPVTGDQFDAFVGMSSWELDLWGRVASLEEAALQTYFSSEAAQRAMRLALISEVATAYIGLRELDARIDIARKTIATREESLRIFKRRTDVGSSSRLELTQVETLLTQAKLLSAQLEQSRASQAHYLDLLVGTPVAVKLEPATSLLEESFPPLAAGIPSETLTVRPDIIAAEYNLRAAQANIDAARAAFFPRITLTGRLGLASATLEDLVDPSSNNAWAFAPAISMPIFDAGRLRNNLDVAEVRGNTAVANYEKTVQSAFREVADALSAQSWLKEQQAIMIEALAIQEERSRLARLRYDSGAATYLQVLDAERDLLTTQQQIIQMHGALMTSQVSLYAALGGGSLAPQPEPADQ
jgi:NodT family efflux transporter outer membrane factor (OMF) lipoprotein